MKGVNYWFGILLEDVKLMEVYFDNFKVTHVKSPVIQTEDYYPFGLTFNSYSREYSIPNQYQYNSKELQDELNLGWLDYGARMYMPEIGRWTTVDPMGEERDWLTPFNYVQNNPINLTDPTGMLDDYGINSEGEVSLLKKTEDKFDRLYAVDDSGNKRDIGNDSKTSNDYVQVNDKSILPTLAEEPTQVDHDYVNVAVSDNGKDVSTVFKFAADNSSVEWRAVAFKEGDKAKFAVGTDHDSGHSPSLLQMGIADNKATYSIHSHPGSELGEKGSYRHGRIFICLFSSDYRSGSQIPLELRHGCAGRITGTCLCL